ADDAVRSSRGAGLTSPWTGGSSTAAAAEPNTSLNTLSKTGRCEWSATKTDRAVQYSRRRPTGRTSPSARANPTPRSGVTGPPAHDLHLALWARVVDPVVQAAALDRVVQVTRAVGRQHDRRRVRGDDRAELGDRHAGLAEQLEQERLEVVVGAVDLVDQQHGRPRAGVLERAQQRPRDQVVAAEEVLLAQRGAARLRETDAQQLPRIVPLVQRLGGV